VCVLQEQSKQKISIYLAKKDDPAYFDDGVSPMDQENRWRAYISSYQTVDPTDGVPRERIAPPVLMRNMRAVGADPNSAHYPPSPPMQPTDVGSGSGADGNGVGGDGVADRLLLGARNEENLIVRVAVNGYKAHFQPNTQEGWSQPMQEREGGGATSGYGGVGGFGGVGGSGRDGVRQAEEDRGTREEAVREMFVLSNKGMVGLSQVDVERANEGFARLAGERVAGEGDGEEMDVDG